MCGLTRVFAIEATLMDSFAEVRDLLRDARARLDGLDSPRRHRDDDALVAAPSPLSSLSNPSNPPNPLQHRSGAQPAIPALPKKDSGLINRLLAGERAHVSSKVFFCSLSLFSFPASQTYN